MLTHTKTSRKENQQGVVSILVSVIIMIILTLTAVSFAQLMRREQRQALDRQLSAQAYYAAETAINDAVYAFGQGNITEPYEECKSPDGQPLSQNVIDEDLAVSYSCVTVQINTSSLEYDAISTDNTEQIIINPHDEDTNPGLLDSLTINWEGNNETNFSGPIFGNPEFPPISNCPPNRPGVLRVEVVPLPDRGGGNINRGTLMDPANNNGRKVFFLYPTSQGPDNIDWAQGNGVHGRVFGGGCDADDETRDDETRDRHCSVTITNLPVDATQPNAYIVRIKSIYKQTTVSINGTLTDNSAAYFKGAQIVVDATGKANDVLRRIRANVSIGESSSSAESAIQSFDGFCKRLGIVDAGDVRYGCFN